MKKKALLLMISLLLSIMTGYSAERYEVFRTSGDVKLFKDYKWVTAKKREAVRINDKVKIGDNSVIGIKDKETKGIFYSSEPGETVVSDIIIAAKKQSKSTTSLLTGAMVDTNSGDSGKSRRNKRVTGVVTGSVMRGPAEKNADTDSVVQPAYSNRFGNMLDDLIFKKVQLTEPDSLRISLDIVVEPEDSVVSYIITDRIPGNDTVYVNVIRLIPGAAPQFMFDGGVNGENIFISGETELKVDWYPSVYDPSAHYMLLVCKSDYKTGIIQGLVNKTFKAQTIKLSKPGFIDDALWNARTWLIDGKILIE